jgi:hypothetical protein
VCRSHGRTNFQVSVVGERRLRSRVSANKNLARKFGTSFLLQGTTPHSMVVPDIGPEGPKRQHRIATKPSGEDTSTWNCQVEPEVAMRPVAILPSPIWSDCFVNPCQSLKRGHKSYENPERAVTALPKDRMSMGPSFSIPGKSTGPERLPIARMGGNPCRGISKP